MSVFPDKKDPTTTAVAVVSAAVAAVVRVKVKSVVGKVKDVNDTLKRKYKEKNNKLKKRK